MVSPSTIEASVAFGWPIIRALLLAAQLMAEGRTAVTPRISPESASSPINSYWCRRSKGIWPEAARIPIAMAKSKRLPSLGSSAGARLIVIRRAGNSKCALIMALRTRSLLSLTAVSGRPTMWNAGNPLDRWTSTETEGASTPSFARVCTTASDIAQIPL